MLRLFQGSTNVDMGTLRSVMFDRGDAALLGRNFAALVTPIWPVPAGQPGGARRLCRASPHVLAIEFPWGSAVEAVVM
jgi:hypothetical protein